MYDLKRRFLIYLHRPVLLFLCVLTIALIVGHPFPHNFGANPAIAQNVSPAQQIQTGIDAYQQGEYREAIATWKQTLTTYTSEQITERAQLNDYLARAHQQLGEDVIALDHWETAAAAYKDTGNTTLFGHMLTEQAQVYNNLGQYERAGALLCGAEPVIETTVLPVSVVCEGGAYLIAQKAEDITGQAAALGSLAETNRLRGKYPEAQQLLEVAIALVRDHQVERYKATLLNSLGNTYTRLSQVAFRRAKAARDLSINKIIIDELHQKADEYVTSARQSLEEGIRVAQAQGDLGSELSTQQNLLLLEQQEIEQEIEQELEQQALEPQALERQKLEWRKIKMHTLSPIRQRLGQVIEQLPPSRETAYAAITLAKAYQPENRDFSCDGYQAVPQQQRWLEKGLQVAETIGDTRAESFALGEFGHVEECQGHLRDSVQWTLQAQHRANNMLEMADSLYLWEWQMGRLYREQGNLNNASDAYAQAIATLENIRTDILTADRDLQYDFRDTVEPVYRQYIGLQLEASPNANNHTGAKQRVDSNDRLKQILKTIDSLRLAELQNFFGNDCVLIPTKDEAKSRLLEDAKNTVVISSIILSDQVALIAEFPDGTSQIEKIARNEQEINTLKTDADNFRSGLKRFTVLTYSQDLAQDLYQQLITPFEEAFTNAGIETLVFVQDGFLRNVPMAALYNDGQYLIERYAVATTPALSLTAPPATERPRPRALAVGLSQETVTENEQEFPPLGHVKAELDSVLEQLPGSQRLLDEEFTTEKLSNALQEGDYSILHLATHGQFSTIPEDSFVITAPDSSGVAGQLTFGELEALIQRASPGAEQIDLITLTACETATGDERATLGFAGVAVRAGARSAISSLWKVNDAAAAKLIERFYRNLRQPQFSKAQALQQAQIETIAENKSANPGYWAPLILVGNWQ